MPIKYVPFIPEPVEGQAVLGNFNRILKYKGADDISMTIQRGMPLYEMEKQETVGENADGNMVIRGECVSACAYLKDFGAATASNGAVGLYHVENLTPEAKELGRTLLQEGAREYVIDDAELQRIYDGYPVIWKNPQATPKLCFMGCPHMSLQQLMDWTDKVENGLKAAGNSRVLIPTVFTAAPAVLKEFEKTPYAPRLKAAGVVTYYICPLMYMNNPLSQKLPVITSSNKLRTYTSARYYTDEEILIKITKGGN